MIKRNSTKTFEILAVILTGAGKILFFEVLHMQFWFIMMVSLFWLGYLVYVIGKNRERITHWGFRIKGLKESIRIILPLAVAALAIMLAYGITSGKALLSWHLLPSLLLYPLWGLAQQFIVLGMVAGNLQDLETFQMPKILIILITAVLFCLVHYPNYPLVGATFLLSIIYCSVYLRYRNLWALGVIHGWLGTFFYYFVLGKDAWMTFIGSI